MCETRRGASRVCFCPCVHVQDIVSEVITKDCVGLGQQHMTKEWMDVVTNL